MMTGGVRPIPRPQPVGVDGLTPRRTRAPPRRHLINACGCVPSRPHACLWCRQIMEGPVIRPCRSAFPFSGCIETRASERVPPVHVTPHRAASATSRMVHAQEAAWGHGRAAARGVGRPHRGVDVLVSHHFGALDGAVTRGTASERSSLSSCPPPLFGLPPMMSASRPA